ncbi:MAG: glucose 1-dehydrogenase [Chromatiales bacterium]|jgi:NAD(P)-dependent dehydrogenase (short-subunit alcohol dehydrogenase family)|nr:glucose 1-dehydrogenase [Chromatiales bacterium]
MNDLFDLSGKVALITGSTKGIGRAIAERMSEMGAKVVVSSRKADACDEVAEGIRTNGGTAVAIPCNINYKEQLQQLVDKTVEAFGQIDILVCNAAVNPFFGPSQDIPDSAFEKILGSNIMSNHWLCQMTIPKMAERREGVVIIISSIGGVKGSAKLGAYCVSKAADMQMARNLAVEWGPSNIRINAIAPGLIKTEFARALWESPEIYERSTRVAPLKRIGDPDEIAGMAIYLSSRAGSFTTGQTICIDGGVTIGEG